MDCSREFFLVGIISCFLTISGAGQDSRKSPETHCSGNGKGESVSEIDFEYSASSLLCARHRIVLRADDGAEVFTERCHNATREDQATFLRGQRGSSLAFNICKTRPNYLETSLVFLNAARVLERRVRRRLSSPRVQSATGRLHEVINYADAGPLSLWAIQRAIEDANIFNAEWQTTTKRSKCPSMGIPRPPAVVVEIFDNVSYLVVARPNADKLCS